ncbi:hypothetical protein EMCRGX_G003820 [Ephydatia muelleri]
MSVQTPPNKTQFQLEHTVRRQQELMDHLQEALREKIEEWRQKNEREQGPNKVLIFAMRIADLSCPIITDTPACLDHARFLVSGAAKGLFFSLLTTHVHVLLGQTAVIICFIFLITVSNLHIHSSRGHFGLLQGNS